jgi:hypothetical protein
VPPAKEPPAGNSGTPAGVVDGKKWEELKSVEKHHLYETNRAAYDALKREYETRTGNQIS